MDSEFRFKLLKTQLSTGREVDITVTGISMEPSLQAGDIITVERANEYVIGDVLVFLYKGELLVHRLIKIEDGRYFCKGDNAFRLEDMMLSDIAGRVTHKNCEPLEAFSLPLVRLSYLVNREFRRCRYDANEVKRSGIYRFYYKTIRKEEDTEMKYQKNSTMDYIPADELTLAIFDPESGDTHFMDETASDIIKCLDEAITLDELLSSLCEIYDTTADDIRADVEEFLTELVSKKIVVAL